MDTVCGGGDGREGEKVNSVEAPVDEGGPESDEDADGEGQRQQRQGQSWPSTRGAAAKETQEGDDAPQEGQKHRQDQPAEGPLGQIATEELVHPPRRRKINKRTLDIPQMLAF